MNFKCAKCGTAIEISPQVTASPEPRVACPRCHARYRLKPRTSVQRKGAKETSPLRLTSAATPSSPVRATLSGTATSPGTPSSPSPSSPPPSVPPPPSAPPPPAAVPASRPSPAPSALPSQPSTSPPSPSSPSLSATGASVFLPGDVLAGRYRVARFLAKGGMGEVYEAEDMELHEDVALKTISAGPQEPSAVVRFKREISLARKVTHPNVCRIFDLGQHQSPGGLSVTFLTMELLQGETLSHCLRRRGHLGTAEALPIARQIAAALDAAHQADVIHRDLKSENIFLVREAGMTRAVVTDFGIARGGGDDRFAAMVTGTGIVGTPAYMSPEQVEDKEVTAAADVYAFGVVLYEMVTGRLPFESDNPITTAAKRLREAPSPPRLHVPDLEARWEEVILRCLERQPGERFASAGEAVDTLERRGPAVPGPGAVPGLPDPTPTLRDRTSPMLGEPSSAGPRGPTAAPTVAPATPAPRTAAGMVTTASLYRPAAAKAAKKRAGSVLPLLATLGVVAAISAGLLAFNWLRRDEPRRSPRRSIAVVGFQNLTGQEEKEWLATALAEMLGTELAHGEALRAIPGDQVARMKREVGLERPTELSDEALRQIHAVLGCDFVVAGSFVTASERVRIDVRLADAAVGKSLASFAHEGSEADLFELVKGLGSDVRERLGVGRTGGAEDPLAGLPVDRQAARLYSEALDSSRRFDPRAARDALQEAARIEPDNPLIRSALSSAWEALGFGERAAEEARRAFELSSELPREDRLLIEGRVRETEGEWTAAIEVYRQLWDFFPDNLEYGLRLAAAQTAAGLAGEALASIDRMRELPAPVSEDVRIDLAAAAAAATAFDFQRQLDAARRGVAKAREIGAALLEAQASIAESQGYRALGQATESAESARRARELFEKVGQPSGRALASLNLASAEFDLAELDDAIVHSEEAIEIFRDNGDEGGLASALNSLALMLKRKGDLGRAQELYEEVETTFERTNNRRGLANALNNQAAILILRDDLAGAREMFERAMTIWKETGDPVGRAISLNNLAFVLRLEGNLEASRRANEEALSIRRRIGQRGGEVFSLINLGGVLADLGELAEAGKLLDEGRLLAAELGHRSALGHGLFELGGLRFLQGRLDEAKALHDEALAVRQELGEKQSVAESYAALARLKLERSEPAAAEIDARHAIDTFSKDGRRAEEGQSMAYLAMALLEQELSGEARRAMGDARQLGGDSRQFAVRFRIRIAEARLEAADRRRGEALKTLLDLDREAAEAGFAALAYEARLTRLVIEGGRSSGALRALGEEATAKGLGWIAAKAEAALR